MFGDIAANFTVTIFEDYRGFLVALLPPGAFIGLGLIVAIKNVIDARKTLAANAVLTADIVTDTP